MTATRSPVERDYSAGYLAQLYGTYENRVPEYRFAVLQCFHGGIMRHDSPILDAGCRNPYEGLLRFLRSFGWDGAYIGIDLDPPAEAAIQAEGEDDPDSVRVLKLDLEKELPFPPTDDLLIKQFAVAYCIETLEHMNNPDAVVAELQRVAAEMFIIGPHAGFDGYYPEVPGHISPLTKKQLEGYGCQHTGYVNFNGRSSKSAAAPYAWDNGDPARCSEVWGLWLDDRAWEMCKPRPRHEIVIDAGEENPMKMLAFAQALRKAGHRLERPERRP